MVVLGAAAAGDAAGEGDGPGEAAGAGGGVGSGSAPATPADPAQPARSSPATANRAARGAPDLNHIERQRTGASSPFHSYVVARTPSTAWVPRPSSKLATHGQRPRESAHTTCSAV